MAGACAGGFPFGPFDCPLMGAPFLGQALSMNNIDKEILWEQIAQLVDDGMLEFGRFLSQARQEAGQSGVAGDDGEQPSTSKFCRDLLARMNEANQKAKEVQREDARKQDKGEVAAVDKWTVSIPLGSNINAADLKVSVKGHTMMITVKKEHVSEDGSSREYREFSKRVDIPEAVKIEEMKSVLLPDGALRIEAPLSPAEARTEEVKPTKIPIRMIRMD